MTRFVKLKTRSPSWNATRLSDTGLDTSERPRPPRRQPVKCTDRSFAYGASLTLCTREPASLILHSTRASAITSHIITLRLLSPKSTPYYPPHRRIINYKRLPLATGITFRSACLGGFSTEIPCSEQLDLQKHPVSSAWGSNFSWPPLGIFRWFSICPMARRSHLEGWSDEAQGLSQYPRSLSIQSFFKKSSWGPQECPCPPTSVLSSGVNIPNTIYTNRVFTPMSSS